MLGASTVVVNLLSHLTTLVRPREVDNGNNEEAEEVDMSALVKIQCVMLQATDLLLESAIPARALYQARKAARIPNPPPALIS